MPLHLVRRREQARDSGLARAISQAGGVAELARKIGLAQPSVSNWIRVPAQRVIAVETATGISRRDLRPDLYAQSDGAIAAPIAGAAEEARLLPQPTGLSDTDRARLEGLNRVWNDDVDRNHAEVLAIYAPLIQRTGNAGISVIADIAYGEDARLTLDVVVPSGAGSRRVLVFVHGSGFRDNVACWFARRGFVAVNVGYRHAPEPLADGADEIGRALRWVAENIARHGGDPADIVLMGHSTGGGDVATYLMDRPAGAGPPVGVTAAILVSAQLPPGGLHGDCPCPVFIAVAEHENRHLDLHALELATRLARASGRAPRIVQAQGHNHASIIAHFNSGDDRLGGQILSFLAAQGRRQTGG